jgi:PPOX class probable F420-dependent enzyme
MNGPEARDLFRTARVARFATVDQDCRPHLVPVVFEIAGDVVYSAVDAKPKRTTALRRIENISRNPRVCLLVDHYDDTDWSALWWVRADGAARILQLGDPEADLAASALRLRYTQYEDLALLGPVIAVDVERWSGWAAG